MRILVIGSGGREHALAWKVAQSPRVERMYIAPGNGGTAAAGENVPIPAGDIPALLAFARNQEIDLTVVGPEAPLTAGLVDAFAAAGLRAFGPTAAAARLEGSKAFAKRFMVEEGIPTARAAIFSDYVAARAYLREQPLPVVVKADGLAAGKGVIVCGTLDEAEDALRQVMVERALGPAGDTVMIEECLVGKEASLLAFCDGRTVVPMLPARDYKRVGDGDSGPNTGGMGGYAPAPHLSPELLDEIAIRVLRPAVDAMRGRGTPYVGVLYAGLMLTAAGPRVLEFNCRFGDPETQVLMPLLETDLVEILIACLEGRLERMAVRWKPAHSAAVVLAAPGYPGSYPTGAEITGLDAAARLPDVFVFHAGTKRDGGRLLTSGGRVLAVTATGAELERARDRAYAAAGLLRFSGVQYRADIGGDMVSRPYDGSGPFSSVYSSAPAGSAGTAPSNGSMRGDRGAAGPPAGCRGGAPAEKSLYAASGVDIAAAASAKARMHASVASTYTPAVLSGSGSFGGLFDITAAGHTAPPVLVASTDGVGTKTLIAAALGRYDTVGHDIVNHGVDDILVQGARPLFFLDYIAAGRLDPDQMVAIVEGCAAACREVGCALLGGETAEMPDVYVPGAFDLAGTMVGWVHREAIVDGHDVVPGDVCLGLPSSGLHTNGYSLARRVLGELGWDTVLPELGRPLGEVLLTPHRAYLRELEALWAAGVRVKAMAHITGGGYPGNIPRVLPAGVGVRLDRAAWEVPPIFRLLQRRGAVADEEMYRVFNMGIGMVLIVPPRQVALAQSALPEALVIGEVVPWAGPKPRVQL